MHARSIFAVCNVYNNLPQHVRDASDVGTFQKYLTQVARMRCQQGGDAWALSFVVALDFFNVHIVKNIGESILVVCIQKDIVIIRPVHGKGEDFRLVGSAIDVKFSMQAALQETPDRACLKMEALVRTRILHNHADMLRQFKTHAWNLVKYHNGVIQHACAFQLQCVDSTQRSYVQGSHLTEANAFVHCNFAPPSLRRNIGYWTVALLA